MAKKDLRIDTLAVHGAESGDPHTGSVAPPLYQTSTFFFKNSDHGEKLFKGEAEGYIYSRLGNPTQACLERQIAVLEGCEAGLAFSSGLAAISALVFTLCETGDNFVSSNTIYGGTHGLFAKPMKRLGIEAREVLATDVKNIETAIDAKTKLIFIETPANPNLAIIDVEKCAEIAHKNGIPLAVDNTFATPILQRPKELGADIIVHSATKYIGGHGDVVAGLLAGEEEFIYDARKESMSEIGFCISPFNAWLLLRGLKTLGVRVHKHCVNTEHVANYLASHPKISEVSYPGLPSHPGHELARKQMKNGFGGMIAFELKGSREEGKKFVDSVELCTHAVSLGDCDTLICHPASTTHSTYSPEELQQAGITDTMIRISVGIEDPRDLCDDLEQALERV